VNPFPEVQHDSDEQVARIRHLFHASIGRSAPLLPNSFSTPIPCAGRWRPTASAASPPPRAVDRSLPRLPAPCLAAVSSPARHPPLADDSAAGYTGSVSQLRRVVADLRPHAGKPFCVCALSPVSRHSRTGRTSAKSAWAAPAGVCPASSSPSPTAGLVVGILLRPEPGEFSPRHVHAFHDWGGAPRSLQTDNLRSVVLERRGDAIHSIPASWNSPLTITSPRFLPPRPRQ